jgi:DNA-binding NarL/FixJ family response regulator
MDERLRIGLVDDNPDFRSEVAGLFHNSPEFKLVAACGNAEEALRDLPLARPHVVFVDLNLPDLSGIEVVRGLRSSIPTARLLILTIEHDGRRLIEALAAGAVGYLVKTTTPERIVDAVREAMVGGSPISSNVARLLVERFQTVAIPVVEDQNLTDRERQILTRFAAGRRAKEIATELDLSVHTIRAAVRTIYAKLEAHSVAEAVAKFKG